MTEAGGSTFVLVHGAWHSGEVWGRVAPLLEEAGHRVLAPTLTGHGDTRDQLGPGVGLDTHVRDVVDLLVEQDLRDVVLVGHSYAGMVISGVAGVVPDRLARLVHLDAMIPTDGQTVLDVRPLTQAMIDAAARTPEPWRIPPLPPTPAGWFGVTDPDDLAWLASLVSDESATCFLQPVRLDDPRQASIPRTYVRCVPDVPAPVAPPPIPDRQPNGDPAEVWELRSGHDCMVTVPRELADLLLRLA